MNDRYNKSSSNESNITIPSITVYHLCMHFTLLYRTVILPYYCEHFHTRISPHWQAQCHQISAPHIQLWCSQCTPCKCFYNYYYYFFWPTSTKPVIIIIIRQRQISQRTHDLLPSLSFPWVSYSVDTCCIQTPLRCKIECMSANLKHTRTATRLSSGPTALTWQEIARVEVDGWSWLQPPVT